jgi:hypothetical protein
VKVARAEEENKPEMLDDGNEKTAIEMLFIVRGYCHTRQEQFAIVSPAVYIHMCFCVDFVWKEV